MNPTRTIKVIEAEQDALFQAFSNTPQFLRLVELETLILKDQATNSEVEEYDAIKQTPEYQEYDRASTALARESLRIRFSHITLGD